MSLIVGRVRRLTSKDRRIRIAVAWLAVVGGCARSVDAPATVLEPSAPHAGHQGVALPDPQVYAASLDARDRHWWQQPEQVVGMLEVEEDMTVVDLGAGTGYFLPYLSDAVGRHGKVLALDAERSMIDSMYRRVGKERLFNVSPIEVAPNDPSLTPRSVDRVLIVNTWHHLTDREAYAEKLFQALRGDGRVLIVDFDADSPKGPPAQFRLSPGAVVAELESAGFTAAVIDSSLPYQYAVEGRLPD